MDAASLDPRLRNAAAEKNAQPHATATAGTVNASPDGANKSPTSRHQDPTRSHAGPTPYAPVAGFSPQSNGSADQRPTPGTTATAGATPSTTHSSSFHPANVGAAAHTPDDGDDDDDDGGDDHHDDSAVGGGGGGPGDPKKPRACESCRGLKVRCQPDAANPDGPCRRCAKAGRACVVTQPTRKRQKKTDSRVAELEKKIDALTASLQASRGGGGATVAATATGTHIGAQQHDEVVAPLAERAGSYHVPSLATRGWGAQAGERMLQPQPKSQSPQVPQGSASQPSFGSRADLRTNKIYPPPMVMAGQKRKFTTESRDSSDSAARETPAATPQSQNSLGHDYLDIVDRGLITMDKAAELFVRYTDHMVPHLPAVVFPAGTTVAEVRKSKPILFLAIMAASSAELPAIQRRMVKEVMEIFAEKVIVLGEKSLELVQALHVSVVWYWPPEHFEELKFYQLVHIAAVMALDIGLGRKVPNRGGFRKYIHSTWKNQHVRRDAPVDPNSIECRRAWLMCFFLATNTSMAMHRPNLIRWSSFMAESVDILESSPDAAPTDKYLCHLVWTHKLAEDVGIQFSMDDPLSGISIVDPRTQYALRAFERELERYKKSVPEEMRQPTLKMSFHVISLYMHEAATQIEMTDECKQSATAEDFRGPLATDAPLTPAHIGAISACLTSIDSIFEVFLAMDVAAIRCLPVFNFIRVAYAFVMLIKMYFAASSPRSELGKVINKDHMKVEQHLDNLLAKFRATAENDKSRPAAKLLIVLAMLRSWLQKQNRIGGGGGGGCPKAAAAAAAGEEATEMPYPAEAAISYLSRGGTGTDKPETGPPTQPQQQQSEYSTTANTPLQLLSEIATNDSAAAAAAAGPPRPSPGDFSWLNRPQPQQPFMYDAGAAGAGAPQQAAAAASSSSAPGLETPTQPMPMSWLESADFNGGFDYANLGDGFAQAMDLTLAGLADGGRGVGFENGIRYIMEEPYSMDSMGSGFGFQF